MAGHRIDARVKRNTIRIGVVVAMLAALLAAAVPTFAVNSTGAFQLDGDAATGTQPYGAPAPDDWDRICRLAAPSTCTNPSPAASTTATSGSWTADGALNASIFVGGGSKDPLDLNQWAWKDNSGGLPDKDNLLHAFAARYSKPANSSTCPSPTPTCEILVFGSDRYDNSGDAQQGFWFFQNKVTLDPKTGKFIGAHRNGDILVVSHFSNGGAVSTIQVFTWDSSIPGNISNPRVVASSPCSSTATDAPACGLVNPANGTPSPWAFKDKAGNTSFAQGEFVEAGINLSDPSLGAANECFSSVLAETRSSDSVSATLKDFILGQFASCTATATSAPTVGSGSTVTPGTPVADTATITGAGVPNAPTPTGSVNFFLCGPVTAPATCPSGGTAAGSGTLSGSGASANATSSPAVDTTGFAPGRYCFRAEWGGDSNYTGIIPGTDVAPHPNGLVVSHTAESECFNVAKLPTVTVTTPTDASGSPTTSVTLGATIHDVAVVTGAATPGDPTGTVDFAVCGPADAGLCTTGGTSLGTKTLVSDGVSGTYTASVSSNDFTPTLPGRYCFRATYNGNGSYLTSSDSSSTECFIVKDTTATTSAQIWLPNDSAHVVLSGGSAASGSIVFTLKSGTCGAQGSTLYTQTVTLDGSGDASTTNTSVSVSTTSDVVWVTTFTPSDTTRVVGSTHCEATGLTITN